MLDTCTDAIATQPTVLLGDLNIGLAVGVTAPPTRRHRAFERLASDGSVSAYHAFHGVSYGPRAARHVFPSGARRHAVAPRLLLRADGVGASAAGGGVDVGGDDDSHRSQA